jgi:hypothetical protein
MNDKDLDESSAQISITGCGPVLFRASVGVRISTEVGGEPPLVNEGVRTSAWEDLKSDSDPPPRARMPQCAAQIS